MATPLAVPWASVAAVAALDSRLAPDRVAPPVILGLRPREAGEGPAGIWCSRSRLLEGYNRVHLGLETRLLDTRGTFMG